MEDEHIVRIWEAVIFGLSWCISLIAALVYKWSKREQEIDRERLRMKETEDIMKRSM